MPGSRDLYELIGTLTKSEKRYCRMMLEGGAGRKASSSLRLFELLTAMSEPTEEKVRTAVAGEAFAGHLPVTKRHLYQHILRSLRSFRGENSTRGRIRALTESAEVLADRGLNRQAREALDAAWRIAEEHDFLVEQLTLLRLEWLLDSRLSYAGVQAADFEMRRERAGCVLRKVENYWDYLHLFSTVSFSLITEGPLREERITNNQWIAGHPLVRSPRTLSQGAARFYFETLRMYYLLSARYYEGYLNSVRYLEFVDALPMNIRMEQYSYVQLLDTHVMLCVKIGKYDEARSTYRRICALEPVTWERRMMVEEGRFTCRVLLLMIDFDHDGLAAMAPELEQLRRGRDRAIVWQTELAYTINLAYARFANGLLREAAVTLHPVINDHRPGFRNDALCLARLLQLMIHYDLGDYELLPYLIRSTYRFFAGCNHLHAFERAVLAFMRRLASVLTSDELRREFESTFTELSSIAADRREYEASSAFAVLPWLESRLTGRPFGDVLRGQRDRRSQEYERAGIDVEVMHA
ncbi:MAG TPA: hypothetical protein VHI13_17495 [Candidatus Kapabacteria bacterium]|nr:hypothetical protein [Candidatus Kapabacteria bacterium]